VKSCTIVTGAYGVGKSEFCIQFALTQQPCYLCDLDVINPYFRPREESKWLLTQGVEITGNLTQNSLNQDLPAINGALSSLVRQGKRVIVDVAGSEAGLKPLATFRDIFAQSDIWLVVNLNRSESELTEIKETIRVFQEKAGFSINGLVHNTHMLDETSSSMLIDAQQKIENLAELLQLPIVFTMVDQHLVSEVEPFIHNPILPFQQLVLRKNWMEGDTL